MKLIKGFVLLLASLVCIAVVLATAYGIVSAVRALSECLGMFNSVMLGIGVIIVLLLWAVLTAEK